MRTSPVANALLSVILIWSSVTLSAAEPENAGKPSSPQIIVCPGEYPNHLQGVCRDDAGRIYWSFTTQLVCTDAQGTELKSIPVASHHGDLCFAQGRIWVAVNLGKFNQPAGAADSWVYEYEPGTLQVGARHPVQQVVHGAGGIDAQAGHFFVVGGLPNDEPENKIYEYDQDWKFVAEHLLASGHTDKGIQTALFHDGAWWFGCYGKPAVLLKASPDLKFQARWNFDAAIGLIGDGPGKFLIARHLPGSGKGRFRAQLQSAVENGDQGIALVK